MYYLYCLCKSVQRSLVSRLLFFSESGCKGKNFKAYLPNIFGSFFSFFFFLFPRRLSCRKGGKKKKEEKKTGHRFLKEECQLALLSFSKAGAKVRTLKHNFQMFPEVFFHFSFPRPKFRKKPMAKKRKMEAYRSVLLSECQNIAAFVPESVPIIPLAWSNILRAILRPITTLSDSSNNLL